MRNTSLKSTPSKKKRSTFMDLTVRLVREKPLGTIGGVITLILLFFAVFANFVAPYGMNETHMQDDLQPSSARHWMGTDNVGRDILTRVIYGARVSVIVGLSGPTVATIISLAIGIVTGYIGGKLDLIVQRGVDTLQSIPSLILLMIIVSVIGAGIWQVIAAMGVAWGIVGSRIIRSAVIGIKEGVYVGAAQSIGCSTPRILIRHILPNIMAPTIILFTTRVPAMILTEASLSFLGFGIPPPTPSWGGMLSGSGRAYMFQAPWMVIWPGIALSVTVYGINVLGDALRDILDPRLRGGAGRFGVTSRKAGKKEVMGAH